MSLETAERRMPPEGLDVFVSYRSQEPDLSLAREFSRELERAGLKIFMAQESLRVGDEWPERIETALNQCGHFLLLLSAESAASDMVTEELRRARSLREASPQKRPRIMPVRVRLPFGESLNYEMDSYLNSLHQLLW
jgi:TIR domain